MSRVITSHLTIFCLLASFIATSADAGGMSFGNSKPSAKESHVTSNRPWGNIGTPKSAPMYQPPPPPASYYMGAAPNTGWYSSMLPPGVAPNNGWYAAQLPENGAATAALPTVEVEIKGSVFYEQQNLVYTVRVVSDDNLKSLNPEMPRIDGAAMEQLSGPVASTRINPANNKRQIINTYRYKIMPIRPGKVIIPAIRFTGTHPQDRSQQRGPGFPATTSAGSFNIAADDVLTLRVRPADPAVNPWLPLHGLTLQANLLQDGPAKAGEPLTMTLELIADGALGNQLPSLEQQLESANYRIYRDSTEIKNAISADGTRLTGIRKETYTVIPLEDGWVRLPEVTLAWWNVDTHSAMLAGLPLGQTDRAAGANPNTALSAAEQPLFPFYFWLPMIVTLCLLAGFWLGAWHRTRPLLRSAAGWLSARTRHALQYTSRVGLKLSPVNFTRRIRVGLAVLMPRSVKLWMCTRCLHAEDDPDTWCIEFKSRVCEHLDIPVHTPLSHVAEKIITATPHAEPARLRALVHSLDGAVYGGSTLDFPVWKRELTEQLRPHLLRRRPSRTRRRKAMLPELNPHSA